MAKCIRTMYLYYGILPRCDTFVIRLENVKNSFGQMEFSAMVAFAIRRIAKWKKEKRVSECEKMKPNEDRFEDRRRWGKRL